MTDACLVGSVVNAEHPHLRVFGDDLVVASDSTLVASCASAALDTNHSGCRKHRYSSDDYQVQRPPLDRPRTGPPMTQQRDATELGEALEGRVDLVQ